eukprot:g1758.t1
MSTTAGPSTKKVCVGVLGGGQLGRMMGIAAHNIGDVVVVPLDPGGALSPAGQVCNGDGERQGTVVQGSFKDAARIRELAAICDVLTVEIEHVNCDVLDELVAEGKPVRPSPGVIRIIQDKFMQKQHFAKHGVALGQFMDAPDAASLAAVGEELGYPYMLKARKGAYDGKGNVVVKSADEAMGSFLRTRFRY